MRGREVLGVGQPIVGETTAGRGLLLPEPPETPVPVEHTGSIDLVPVVLEAPPIAQAVALGDGDPETVDTVDATLFVSNWANTAFVPAWHLELEAITPTEVLTISENQTDDHRFPSQAEFPAEVPLDIGHRTELDNHPSEGGPEADAWSFSRDAIDDLPWTEAGDLALPAGTVLRFTFWIEYANVGPAYTVHYDSPAFDSRLEVPVSTATPEPVDAGTYTDHPSITIVGDVGPTGFALGHDPVTGQAIHRPGSGVVAGNGTPGDPYIIEGWRTDRILLADTSAPVVVRENSLRDPDGTECAASTAIQLVEASNVTIERNQVVAGLCGITIQGGSNVHLVANHVLSPVLDGIRVIDTRQVRILSNTVTGAEIGINTDDAEIQGGVVEDNTVLGNTNGIEWTGDGTRIAGNRFLGNEWGIELDGQDLQILANRIEGGDRGLELSGSGHTVEGNEIRWTDGWRSPVRGSDHTLRGNILSGNDRALTVTADDTVVEGNIFVGNENGLAIDDHPTGVRVESNTVLDNDRWGIRVDGDASDTVIASNGFEDNRYGLQIDDVDGSVTLTGNTFDDDSILLDGSSGLTLRSNTFTDAGIRMLGYDVDHYRHDIDATNRVNGLPIAYIVDADEPHVTGPAGQIILVNATGGSISGASISDTLDAITLVHTNGTHVHNNTIEDVARGIVAREGARALDITDNAISNVTHGIWLDGQARVAENTISNASRGIRLQGAEAASFEGNLVDGFHLYGLSIGDAPGAVIEDNILRPGPTSVYPYPVPGLYLDASPGATLSGNEIGNGVVPGSSLASMRHEVDGTNRVNGEPLAYLLDETNVTLTGTYGQIVLGNTTGTSLVDVDVTPTYIGLFGIGCRGTSLDDVTVTASTFGVFLGDCDALEIRGSSFAGAVYGISVLYAEGLTFEGNHLHDSPYGAALYEIDGATIEANLFEGPGSATLFTDPTGLIVREVRNATVARNTFRGHAGGGLYLGDIESLDVLDNNVTRNGKGIWLGEAAEDVAVHGNNIWDNEELGLVASSDEPVDATGNWWGCPDGPDAAACDPVLGDVAYEPWRTEPNGDAGAPT